MKTRAANGLQLEMPDFSLMGNKNLPPITNVKKQPGNSKPIQNNSIELPMNKVYIFINIYKFFKFYLYIYLKDYSRTSI